MNQNSLSKPSEPKASGDSEPKRMRILLGQLGSNGDCLYATAIARQIKHDYPGCHLIWAIGSMYRQILDGNPDVDEIWEIPLMNSTDMFDTWQRFEEEALERKKKGDFDEIFLTQIAPNNLHNYDGTVRSSIFRAYPRPLSVPVSPVVRLLPPEIEKVRSFVQAHNILNVKNVILFECSFKSGQSFVNPEFALKVAEKVVNNFSDVCIILSSNEPIISNNKRIIDGSVISFRENAELTKYCSLLIGCSSGISWLCTSDWAKPLMMIQLLKKETSVYASFVHDYEYYGLDTNSIIEMTDCSPEKLFQCVFTTLTEGFDTARCAFHEEIPLTFNFYSNFIYNLLSRHQYLKIAGSLFNTVNRYGLHPKLIESLASILLKINKQFLLKFIKNH